MIKPDKLLIATSITQKMICEIDGELRYWEGNAESSTKKVEDDIASQVDLQYANDIAKFPFDLCKEKAKELIAKTDWAALPDVGLVNQSDFIAYRAALRALIINPVADPVFPTEPQPVWS